MKKAIAFQFLLFYFFISGISLMNAQTNVSGFISSNTTWILSGSPYIVTGNMIVSSGVTLTIDPGVVVKFDQDKTIQVDGEFHAVGMALNRITFTSNKPSPGAGNARCATVGKQFGARRGSTGSELDDSQGGGNECRSRYCKL
jgi:hypothetical protein